MRDIVSTCELFYAAHYLPCACFMGGEAVAAFSPLGDEADIFAVALDPLFSASMNPCVFVSRDAGAYGAVRLEGTDEAMVVGPVFGGAVSDEVTRAFMTQNGIPLRRWAEVAGFLGDLPAVSYNQFLNLLAFMHHEINGVRIDVAEHFRLNDTSTERELADRYAEKFVEAYDPVRLHGTYEFERLMIDCVRRGATAELEALLAKAAGNESFAEGRLAANPLRQAKDIFIGLASMVGKVGGVEGGTDVEEAYQLIDLYIQECEKTNSVELIKTLQYNLLLDFADRVARHKLPPGLSPEVGECVRFVLGHVSGNIGIDDVARHIGRSRAYTTRRFKAEMGRTIGFFITQTKIEVAKGLLEHTGMSIADVSAYLAFSSQAYFQTVFKRWEGLTPGEWRTQALAEASSS